MKNIDEKHACGEPSNFADDVEAEDLEHIRNHASEYSTAFLLKVLGDSLRRRGDNELRADGLTHSQMGVLVCLSRSNEGVCSFKDVQRFMRVSQPTTTGLISRLEQKGFVETFSCSTDQRAKMVKITATGTNVLDAGHERFMNMQHQLESGITPEELEEFKWCMVRMISNISSPSSGAGSAPEHGDYSEQSL